MNARHAFWAKGLLLVSGAGLLINGAAVLIAQTDSGQAARTPVQQAAAGTRSAAAHPESLTPIQKALRERYRRAGLEMPLMNLSALPKTADAAKKTVRNRRLQKPGIASRSAVLSRQAGRPVRHASSATRKPGLLSRILPARSRIHWPARPKIHWPARLTPWNRPHRATPRIARQPSGRPKASAGKSIVQKKRQTPGILHPAETKQVTAPKAAPLMPTPIAKLQPTGNEPHAVPGVAAKKITKPQVEADDGLTNPFTEMSEAEADKKAQSPFTGLKLNGAATADNRPPVIAEKPRSADNAPPLPHSTDTDIAQTAAETAQSAKLHRIAERSGQTGFKGFCPVVLRDQRNLVDAKAEFLSTYKSRTYHFSSAEAKADFDAHPEKYAPAGAGLDVVRLANHGDRVDGSLEYAVWFQDRLYLFSTADSLRTFTLAPADYAVTESR